MGSGDTVKMAFKYEKYFDDAVCLQRHYTIRENFPRHVYDDIKLYRRTFDETTIRKLTINYFLSEMITKLLIIIVLVTTTAMKPSFAVQGSYLLISATMWRKLWWRFHSYDLKPTCQVALILVRVLPIKSFFNPQAYILDWCSTVQRNILSFIILTPLSDFKRWNNTTVLGIRNSSSSFPFAMNGNQTDQFANRAQSKRTLLRR